MAPYLLPLIDNMIYIHETFSNQDTVTLGVEGSIDRESLPSLEEICHWHLKKNRNVSLDLKGLMHINSQGRHFLRSIKAQVTFVSLPQFLKLELDMALRFAAGSRAEDQ